MWALIHVGIAIIHCSMTRTSVGGVPVRRVGQHPYPWVYEADLAASQSGSITRHDPLSSCFWPAATALASLISRWRWDGQRCLELGCGTGLCSLTAATMGAASVMATDVSLVSLQLTQAAAADQRLNVSVAEFDVLSNAALITADVLILSDLFVTEDLARAHARRVHEAMCAGFETILVVDPGRSTRAVFTSRLEEYFGSSAPKLSFEDADSCLQRLKRNEQLVLLNSQVGAPISYDI